MKPIVLAVCLAVIAMSLYASDPPVQGNDSKIAPATHTQTVLSLPENVSSSGDSPLVRAAKSSRRSMKKSTTVITNETLVRTGGHFTTTTPQAQQPITNPTSTAVSWDQMIADVGRKKIEAASAAAQARKLEEQKRLATARQAALMDGDTPEAVYNEQPAIEGGTLQPLKPTVLPTTG